MLDRSLRRDSTIWQSSSHKKEITTSPLPPYNIDPMYPKCFSHVKIVSKGKRRGQHCFKGEGEGSTLFQRGGGVNIVTKGRRRGNIVSKGRERGERRNSSETTLRLL